MPSAIQRLSTIERIGWSVLVLCIAGFVVLMFARFLEGETADGGSYRRCGQHYFAHDNPEGRRSLRRLCGNPYSLYVLTRPLFSGRFKADPRPWNALIIVATVFAHLIPLLILVPLLPPGSARGGLLLGWAPMIFTDPFWHSVTIGNASPIVATFVAVALWALVRRPPGAGLLAGVALALGALLKIFPIFLAGYLLVEGLRRRQRLFLVAGGLAIALFLAGQLFPGSLDHWIWTLSPGKSGMQSLLHTDQGSNSSLVALLYRLDFPLNTAVLFLIFGLPLAVVLLRRQWPVEIAFGLVALFSVQISPTVWQHTLTIVALPLLLFAAMLVRRGLSYRVHPDLERKRTVLGVLGLCYCLLVVTNSEYLSELSPIGIYSLLLAAPMPLVLATLLVVFFPALSDGAMAQERAGERLP